MVGVLGKRVSQIHRRRGLYRLAIKLQGAKREENDTMTVCYFLGLYMNYCSLLNEIILKRWFVNMNMHSPEVKNISKKCITSTPNMNIRFLKISFVSAQPKLCRPKFSSTDTPPSPSPHFFSPRFLFLSPAKFEQERCLYPRGGDTA